MPTADEIPEALRPPAEEQIPRITLKVSEAAKAVGVCEKTLKGLGASGPPFLKCGVTRLYPVESLRQWAIAMAAAKAEISTKAEASTDGDADEAG